MEEDPTIGKPLFVLPVLELLSSYPRDDRLSPAKNFNLTPPPTLMLRTAIKRKEEINASELSSDYLRVQYDWGRDQYVRARPLWVTSVRDHVRDKVLTSVHESTS